MRVFVNSLPKSGTNLLEKLIRMLDIEQSGRSIASTNIIGRHSLAKSILHQDHFSGMSVPIGLEFPVSVSMRWLDKTLDIADGQYLSGHAAFSEQLDYLVQKNNVKTIQIFRDPRAVLLSWAKYVVEDTNSWYTFHHFFKKMDLNERILFLLKGGVAEGIYYSSFREVLNRAGGWLGSQSTLVVRFEDLVGSQGGGSDEMQRKTIENILQHIGYEYQTSYLDWLQKDLFGGTHTFRGGRIDGWKDVIDDELNDLIIQELKGCGVVRKLYANDFL